MEAGELVLLTTGEYSDYRVHTLCKVTKDFDPDAMLGAYLELFPEQRDRFKFEESRFLKWLIVDSATLEELEYSEWHFASYGSFKNGYGIFKNPTLASVFAEL